jgi:DNA-binding MarR family transcriptional regulator
MNRRYTLYNPLDESIGYLLRRAQATARLAFDAALADYEITAPQFAILYGLHRDPGQSSADLTRRSTMTAQAVNLIVKDLERRKLLRREPHPEHGRILRTELTAEGRILLKKCLRRVRLVEARMLDGLDGAAESIIRTWLIDIAHKLDLNAPVDAAGDPPALPRNRRSRKRAA